MPTIQIRSSDDARRLNEMLGKRPILLQYHMDGCMYCDMLKPTWEQMKSDMLKDNKLNDLIIAEVERAHAAELNMPDVYKFPTIHLVRKDKQVREFSGTREKEAMKRWVADVLRDDLAKIKRRTARKKRRASKRRSRKTSPLKPRRSRKRVHSKSRRRLPRTKYIMIV
jgi:thioredoxin-like negative regulator of GroEL